MPFLLHNSLQTPPHPTSKTNVQRQRQERRPPARRAGSHGPQGRWVWVGGWIDECLPASSRTNELVCLGMLVCVWAWPAPSTTSSSNSSSFLSLFLPLPPPNKLRIHSPHPPTHPPTHPGQQHPGGRGPDQRGHPPTHYGAAGIARGKWVGGWVGGWVDELHRQSPSLPPTWMISHHSTHPPTQPPTLPSPCAPSEQKLAAARCSLVKRKGKALPLLFLSLLLLLLLLRGRWWMR